MIKKHKSENPTQAQVFELLGRALFACNIVELQLRWMHKHAGGIWTGKTPEELLESIKKAVEKQQKDNKRMLGLVGPELIDAIYTPRCNKDQEAAEKESLFACKIDVKVQSKGRLRRAKAKFKKFIEVRNYLVHYIARDYDLAEPQSCKKAYDDLEKKCKVIKDAAEFFDKDYNLMNATLRAYSEEILKQFKSEIGALRGVPARKGSEQRRASEGKTCPSK
jgi:hypothetical protein